jgi:hypothetical protein
MALFVIGSMSSNVIAIKTFSVL